MSGTFAFDDRTIPFRPGQSVGAALLAAGVRSWRTTRQLSRPRGIFCGIGACFDCLVTVDGQPNRRACLVSASPGLVIRSQEGGGRAGLAG